MSSNQWCFFEINQKIKQEASNCLEYGCDSKAVMFKMGFMLNHTIYCELHRCQYVLCENKRSPHGICQECKINKMSNKFSKLTLTDN